MRMAASVSVATGLYGISFGALGAAAGLTRWQTQVLSLFMFTGGSQFAFVGTLIGGGGAATAAASVLGIRNGLYAARMNPELRPSLIMRPLAAQMTIDESFATALAQDDPVERRRGFWAAGVGVYLLWNLFTFVGAWLGAGAGDPKQWGLDGAAVASFLGLLWPRLRQRDCLAAGVAAAFITVLSVPWLPAGIPILVAGVVAVIAGTIWERLERKGVQLS